MGSARASLARSSIVLVVAGAVGVGGDLRVVVAYLLGDLRLELPFHPIEPLLEDPDGVADRLIDGAAAGQGEDRGAH